MPSPPTSQARRRGCFSQAPSSVFFPQGAIASCAPGADGLVRRESAFHLEAGLLCLLILRLLPLHVWSVMVSHRDDYINAGINFFP